MRTASCISAAARRTLLPEKIKTHSLAIYLKDPSHLKIGGTFYPPSLLYYGMSPAILFSRKEIHNFPYTFLVKTAYLTQRLHHIAPVASYQHLVYGPYAFCRATFNPFDYS